MIKQYPLRIDSELKEQLEKEAKEQKRSFNNLVEVILTEYAAKIHEAYMSEKE